MGVIAGIYIEGSPIDSNQPYARTLIQNLEREGWTLDVMGKSWFLPVNDKGLFDWQSREISRDRLLEIVTQKEGLMELVGVIMLWQDTHHGCTFLLDPDHSINIETGRYRRTIEGVGVTDPSWYLQRLMPAIHRTIRPTKINFNEHR